MKKLFLISILYLLAFSNQAQNVPEGYVDLGLPSGTLWKSSNESGFYSRNDAVSQFGGQLPTPHQWAELGRYCSWSWTGNGYKIQGTNGVSIFLPAAGYSDGNGNVSDIGTVGDYWVFSNVDGMSDFSFDELDDGTLEGVLEIDNPDLYGCLNLTVRLVLLNKRF